MNELMADVWKVLKEVAEVQKKTEKAQQQNEKELKELGRRLDQAIGNFNDTWDPLDWNPHDELYDSKWDWFMERIVKRSLAKLLEPKGIHMQRVQPRLNFHSETGMAIGSFDLVAINREEIVAVKVEITLSKEDLKKILVHLKKFKQYFPEHGDKVIYGGVAYMENADDAGKAAMEQGLFAIAAPGKDASVVKMVNPEGFTPKAF